MFGIGPGEFIVVLLITLVVVGPERMPDLARRAGKMIVAARNWLQKSPDAAMVLRARQEIEQELSLLRSSLMEVQNVRNEVLEAAKQVTKTVQEDVLGEINQGLNEIKSVPGTVGRSLNGPAAESTTPAEVEPPTLPVIAESEPPAPPMAVGLAEPAPSMLPMVAEAAGSNGQMTTTGDTLPTQAPVYTTDLMQLTLQLQTIATDLQALQEALKLRGLLDTDWQPPSSSSFEAAVVSTSTEERA